MPPHLPTGRNAVPYTAGMLIRKTSPAAAWSSTHVLAQVETWLDTGLVMPGRICSLEQIVRELGRRLKKLGCDRADEGMTRVAKMLPKNVYEPQGWDDFVLPMKFAPTTFPRHAAADLKESAGRAP